MVNRLQEQHLDDRLHEQQLNKLLSKPTVR